MRTDPPTSVPIPTTDPPDAINAASPPDDPPGTRSLFHGFKVTPNNYNQARVHTRPNHMSRDGSNCFTVLHAEHMAP
jgi:hypothetical protein